MFLKGGSKACIVQYSDGRKRRFDASAGYIFSEFVDVDTTREITLELFQLEEQVGSEN